MIRLIVFTAALLFSLSACSRSPDESPTAAALERARLRAAAAPTVPLSLHILVDQFGYRPQDRKFAVIRSPAQGFDAGDTFKPGRAYEVRRQDGDAAVFSGEPKVWKAGEVQASSGDKGWWMDFSALDKPGRYYVYDTERKVRSAVFSVDADVYRSVLKTSVRMFFYQRSGFAKQAPFADACWTDRASYLGPGQDLEVRDVTDPGNKARLRDLSGGWHDAGDNNKYVTFAVHAVHPLLGAYSRNPGVFTDDFNLPESGNGVPDLLDEVKWEIDWVKMMQNADGSVLQKVGTLKATQGSPSTDAQTRYYVPACTSSTIAAASLFAHAAAVFKNNPSLKAESTDLAARAVRSFDAFERAPRMEEDCDREIDGRRVLAGDADMTAQQQRDLAVVTAVYLHMGTGEPRFAAYVQQHYRSTRPYRDFGWSRYEPYVGQALLEYAAAAGTDPELSKTLLRDKLADVRKGMQVYGANDDDLYRNFMHDEQYHWGSNAVRANYGGSNLDVVRAGVDADNADSHRTRALDTLHYFHGVNPFGHVYLSNMYENGATHSVDTTWHSWFSRGTRWSDANRSECGPAPGYLTGGPNLNSAKDGVPKSRTPPNGQPAQKSYLDWNATDEAAWAVTESSIGYQASYVNLLSGFVP